MFEENTLIHVQRILEDLFCLMDTYPKMSMCPLFLNHPYSRTLVMPLMVK